MPLGVASREVNFVLDHKIYWNASSSRLVFPGNLSFVEWREKWNQEEYSLVADTLFAPKNHNCEINSKSAGIVRSFATF
jgi:hypothetical protein